MMWNAGQHVFNGHYVIERKLGEGGFGITYLATTPTGDRKVLKTLHDKVLNNPTRYPIERDKLLQNFRKETAILLECRHPNIVRVESFFEEDGLPCIVMEYIEGGTLREQMHQQGALSEAEALQYIQQVGDALTLIHGKKLLHRDINPNNIMRRADIAEAVLIDFGIAREFIRNMPQWHTALATPGYAPLEQYYDQAKRGEFTDVYALAATLYALLTGESPIPSLDRQGELHEQRPDPLRPLIQVNPNVSNRVSDAVIWGMKLDYKQRPKWVGEWLARLLGDNSAATILPPEISETAAFPDPQAVAPPAQTWEGVPINSHYVDQLAFSPDGKMLATYCGGTIKLWDVASGREICTTAAGWAEQRILAEENRVLDSDLFFSSDGKTLVGSGFIWTLESGKITETKVLKSPFKDCYWSNDAVSPSLQVAVSFNTNDNILKLWETITKTEIHTLKIHTSLSGEKVRDVYANQFSPDGRIFASLIYLDGQVEWKRGKDSGLRTRLWEVIKLWEVETGKELCSISLPDVLAETKYAGTFALSSDNRILASNCGDTWRRVIVLWDTATGKELYRFQGFGEQGSQGLGRVVSLTFSLDNQFLAIGDSTGTIALWKLQKGLFGRLTTKKVQTFISEYKSFPRDYAGYLVSLPFSPDGQTLASGFGSKTGGIILWDVKSGQKLKTLPGHSVLNRSVTNDLWFGGEVAVSPDGKTIATKDHFNRMIKLWDTQSGTFRREISYKSHQCYRLGKLAFSRNGEFLVGVLDDPAMMIVWDVLAGEEVELKQYPGRGWWNSGTVNQYGDLVAFVERQPGGQLKIQVLEVRTGQIICTLTGDYKRLERMTFSLDKRLLVAQHSASELSIWDLRTGQLIRAINTENKDQDYREHPILFSPNGEILAIAATENITLWRVSTGEKIHTIQLDTDRLGRSLAFSPDGRTIVFSSGYHNTEMKLWDVQSGSQIGTLGYAPLNSKVTSFHFSSDGKTLVSSYDNGTIQVWQQ